MKISLLTLCDHAAIDKQSGKLSIIGIKDKQLVKKIPGIQPEVHFGAVIRGQASTKSNLKLIITDPDNKKMLTKDIEVQIGDNHKSNLALTISNLEVTQPGKYILTFKNKTQTIEKLDFYIVAPAN